MGGIGGLGASSGKVGGMFGGNASILFFILVFLLLFFKDGCNAGISSDC